MPKQRWSGLKLQLPAKTELHRPRNKGRCDMGLFKDLLFPGAIIRDLPPLSDEEVDELQEMVRKQQAFNERLAQEAEEV